MHQVAAKIEMLKQRKLVVATKTRPSVCVAHEHVQASRPTWRFLEYLGMSKQEAGGSDVIPVYLFQRVAGYEAERA